MPWIVAAVAEMWKLENYQGHSPEYMFLPIAIETLSLFVPKSLGLLKELGGRIADFSEEPKSTEYFFSGYR